MKVFKSSAYLLLVMILSIGMFACSKENNNSKPKVTTGGTSSELELGTVLIKVTGHINAEYEGVANTYPFNFPQQFRWEFDMFHSSLGDDGFEFSLIAQSPEEINRPKVGNHVIGFKENSPTTFHPTYTDNIINDIAYTTWNENAGTLIIEVSNEEEVSGRFNFQAVGYEPNEVIEVTGRFRAKNYATP